MVAKILEMVVKPGAAAALSHVVENRGVPLAERSGGFLGKLVMVLREEKRIVVFESFWDTEEDVARYEEHTFPRIRSLVMPFIDGDLRARTFLITSQSQKLSLIKGTKKAKLAAKRAS